MEGLDILSKEFTTEEIEGVLKHLKTDRAPGPDVLMECLSRNAGI